MGTPQFSVSECTTFPASFAEDVAGYRAGGADGIGIWEFKLERGRDAENLALLRESGLRATICVPEVPSIYPDGYFTEPANPQARTRALADAVRRFAPFDPVAILAVTGNPQGQDLHEMRRVTVAGLRDVAKVAAEVGTIIGVEFYRVTSGAMVNTLRETVELVDEIDEPNVSVVLDVWHAWDDPRLLEDINRYASRLIGVQVNDHREPTRSWADRVLPGDGTIDLPPIFQALNEGGFDGWYDMEIFSDDGRFGNAYPDSIATQDPEDVTRRGRAGFLRAWERGLGQTA